MKSRWMEFRADIGGGESVEQREVIQGRTVADGGGVGWRRETGKTKKTVEKGGAVGAIIKVLKIVMGPRYLAVNVQGWNNTTS